MMLHRVKNKINKAGFMLSELLVVIAIMAILAGVSFVGVTSYIRGLQVLEMDETAKEMLIAAQNHLSSAYASGEYEEELGKLRKKAIEEGDESILNAEFGTKLESLPAYITDVGDMSGDHEYRVVFHTASSSKNKILNYMLPMFAINSEVAEDGNYMIIYEANSGTVLSVFYSGNSHTAFGGMKAYTFSDSDIDNSDIDEAVNSKSKRKNFTDDTVIGYFGGKNKEIIPGANLLPLILSVKNGNKLTAIIKNPNYSFAADAANDAQIVTLTVTGKTSGKSKTIPLTNSDNIEFDIDDISTPFKKFNDQFSTSGLIPGEDIEVVAMLSDNSRIAAPVESNHVIENSIFNSYNRYDGSVNGSIIISNIRHLENLDRSISSFASAARDLEIFTNTNEIVAKQISNIDYSDFTADCGNTIYDCINTSISNFYGISNVDLKEYDGAGHAIKNIFSTSGNGGNSGLIGTVNRGGSKSFRMKNLEIVDSGFSSSTGNAGSAIGKSSSDVELQYVKVTTNKTNIINISSTSGNAGGLIGETDGSLTIKDSFVSGDVLKVSGNNAGGVIGRTTGNVDIKDTYSTAYVYAKGIAGGFIGSIDKVSAANCNIERCYVSGHTDAGYYGENTNTNETDFLKLTLNYNIISDCIAGGFIGDSSSTVNIKASYTTASVYSTDSSTGIVGGFAGNVVSGTNLSVNNVYSAGLVSVAAGGKVGGFLGLGNITADENNNYYLKGQYTKKVNGVDQDFAFNDYDASGNGNITGISETVGEEIFATIKQDAEPWDAVVIEKSANKYDYKTVSQLSGINNTLKKHVGDWVCIDARLNDRFLFVRNAEKLAIMFKGKAIEKKDVSVLIEGQTSKKTAFTMYNFNNGAIKQYSEDEIKGKITLTGGDSTGDIPILDPEADLNKKIVSNKDSEKEYYIFYDDITSYGHNFAAIFDDFEPGEDIKIAAIVGAYSPEYIKTNLTKEKSYVQTAITNSLFADGSNNNSNYITSEYYSDVNPDYAIVSPVSTTTDPYQSTALVTNFRHLQNLDKSVSGVNKSSKTYTRVKIFKDLYWKASVSNTEGDEYNEVPENAIDFITAINNDTENNSAQISEGIKLYKYSSTSEDDSIAEEDSFYGIVNEDLVDFDGQNHKINNMYINISDDAGLFRSISIGSGKVLNIHDLKLVEPVVFTTGINVGGLAGKINETDSYKGEFRTNNVYLYGKYALIKTTNAAGEAGGFFGYGVYGKYTISNCGASVYVYADQGDCAGGFIGVFKPKDTTTITNCFVGGHVVGNNISDTSLGLYYPDYLNDMAVEVDSVTISRNREGGYNVYGGVSVGGFIGYIGKGNININNCFTTASVNSPAKNNNSSITKRRAVGGFVGRLQAKGQKYSNCYVEGRVYKNADYTGYFVGHNYESDNEPSVPTFDNVLILHGIDYNDDQTIKVLNANASDESTAATGISFAEFNTRNILNPNPEYVKVKTFNLASSRGLSNDNVEYDAIEFPYKNTASDSKSYVFYGDWVEPQPTDPVKIKNENRLKADISLTYFTKSVSRDADGYFSTYIHLYGNASGANAYYRIRYKSKADVIVERMNIGEHNINYQTADPSVVSYEPESALLTFYIDNISNYGYNYAGIMQHAWPQCIPGEPVTLYASGTIEDTEYTGGIIKSEKCPSDKAESSLFEKLEKNTGAGDTTYTAYVANSRHLENLNSAISRLSANNYKVTKVVLTDNIYWQDNGTYGSSSYTAGTMPYLTELPDSYICYDSYSGSIIHANELNTFMPLVASDSTGSYITELDGQNKTIYKLKIGDNSINTSHNVGIFGVAANPLTIERLKINDATVTPPYDNIGTSAGLLVGSSSNTLTVKDVDILGTVNIDNRQWIGGVVGSGMTVNATNLRITADMNVGSNKLSAYAGGVAGHVSEDMTVNSSYINNNALTVHAVGQCFAGGIAGKVGKNFTFNNSNLSTNSLAISSGDTGNNYSGGFAGYVEGNTNIGTSQLIVSNGTISARGGNDYAGGFVGYANGTVNLNDSSTGDDIHDIYYYNLNISSEGTSDSYAGGFIGLANTDLIMNNIDTESLENALFRVNSTSSQKTSYSGGFAGHVRNKVECNNSSLLGNVYARIEILSDHISGGLFGSIYNYADIQNSCIHTTTVTVEGDKYVGGVIGTFEGNNGTSGDLNIQNVFVYTVRYDGHVKLNNNEGDSYVGGFIGRTSAVNKLNILRCFSCMNVEAEGTGRILGAGGFSGNLEVNQGGSGTVSRCYVSGHYSKANTCDLKSNGTSVGGFSGSILGKITLSKCWATTVVIGSGNSSSIGGFAGKIGKGVKINEGCYTVGKVYRSVVGTAIGQFIGYVTSSEPNYYLDKPQINEAYYVDRYYVSYYQTQMSAIGGYDQNFTNNIGEELRSNFAHIEKDTSTSTQTTYIFDQSVFPVGQGRKVGYPFKNWTNTIEFHGEWDYNFYRQLGLNSD